MLLAEVMGLMGRCLQGFDAVVEIGWQVTRFHDTHRGSPTFRPSVPSSPSPYLTFKHSGRWDLRAVLPCCLFLFVDCFLMINDLYIYLYDAMKH